MANLVELFDNIVQMQNLNGVPLAAGKLYVYALGRTRLMDTWSDVDGESLNPNPIILDDAGQAHVYCSDDFDYTLVVCDQYNNEIFSLDKYLYSKGSHSHADVAVAPSESIAVSSYHVGECTVYVPYLTGQLGKVYEGIDPIVVNNQVDKISANHVPLGVQDPLYFVQDDEEACIIGCSAQTEIPSALSSKWDEASDVVIANSAQWAEGTTYEAGSYVDIDGNTINVTGLQPAGNYQSAGDYVVHDELSSYATQDWVENQSYMKEYMESAFYPSTSNPSGYLTAHQDISNKLDVSAFSTVSSDFLTAIPDNYATKDYVQSGLSSKLDSSSFASVSSTFLTAHQSLDGLMSADLLEISDNKITGYNGTAFAGQGGVTGDFTLVEGNGIQLTDDPIAQTTTISVSGDYATNTQLQSVSADITAMIPTALTGDYLDKASADTLYYPLNSNPNNYLTALPADVVYTADIQDMAPTGDLTGKQDITGMTAYATVESLTAKQEAGDYLSATDSANFLLTSDSGNFYPSDNPSAFITGVDLTPYQLTADMTAYQPAGDYMTTADSANFYTTANESGFITGVPAGTMNESAFEYDANDKISGYNGSAFAGGSDVPEGVMAESGLEYNAVQEISGYNGSAIAQYGAEKQWLVHDDTLVHASNSAQYALGVNLSAVAQLLGVDETVLWTGTITATGQSVNLNEPISNFSKLKFVLSMDSTQYEYVDNNADRSLYTVSWQNMSNNAVYLQWMRISANNDKTKIAIDKSKALAWPGGTTAVNATAGYVNWEWTVRALTKVIGIGRKS